MATLIKAEIIANYDDDALIANHSETIEPENGTDFHLPELYRMLECELIQVLPMPTEGLIMIIDDEGKLTDKPMNKLATDLIAANLFPGDYIVGHAIICTDEELK